MRAHTPIRMTFAGILLLAGSAFAAEGTGFTLKMDRNRGAQVYPATAALEDVASRFPR